MIDAKKWNTYLGDVDTKISIPSKLDKIWQSPCPFWAGKKIKETHTLTWIPCLINNKPLHLDLLGELIQTPRQGKPVYFSPFNGHYERVAKTLGKKNIEKPYWFLMTKKVVPGTRGLNPSDQKKVIENLLKKNHLSPNLYETPLTIEACVSIVMHYFTEKKYLYPCSSDTCPLSYTICQETMDDDPQRHVCVGNFRDTGGCLTANQAVEKHFNPHKNICTENILFLRHSFEDISNSPFGSNIGMGAVQRIFF